MLYVCTVHYECTDIKDLYILDIYPTIFNTLQNVILWMHIPFDITSPTIVKMSNKMFLSFIKVKSKRLFLLIVLTFSFDIFI